MIKPFYFYCQKILPLVYDESLSYYEILCKTIDYLNTVISTTNTLTENINDLSSYVQNYFSNLNLQTEINNKLDELVKNGQLSNIWQNKFGESVSFFGAKGDGVTDDTEAIVSAFNSAINNNGCVIFESGKKYKVNNLNIDSTARIIVLGNNAEIISNTTVKIKLGQNSYIENLIFNGNGMAETTLLLSLAESFLINCTVYNGTVTNLILNKEYYATKIVNCVIGDNKIYTQKGVIINATDCLLINTTVINHLSTAIEINGAESYLISCHCWCNKAGVGGEYCFKINHSARLLQCYSDTYQKAFAFSTDDRTIFITQCVTSFYAIDDSYNMYAFYLDGASTLRNVCVSDSYINGYSSVIEKCNFSNVRLYNLRMRKSNNVISNNFNDINKIFGKPLITANNTNVDINSVTAKAVGSFLILTGTIRSKTTPFSGSQTVININTSAVQIYGNQYFKDVYANSINDYAYLTNEGVIGIFIPSGTANTISINLCIPLRENYFIE